MRTQSLPRERRHTFFFLKEIRAAAPVFIDAEIDMSQVQQHRAMARYSVVAYVLYVAARVLVAHPAANAAIRGGVRPRLAQYPEVNGKLTLDKSLNGQRVVLATVLPALHRATLEEVQCHIARFRDGDPAKMPEFGALRTLHSLPWPLSILAFRSVVRPLRKRPTTMGTFAVTSLGHGPVDSFYSVGGTTVTLGLGRIADRPVARDGQVVIVPVMRLSLTFDHRLIDGAEASEVLAEIKQGLESFRGDTR